MHICNSNHKVCTFLDAIQWWLLDLFDDVHIADMNSVITQAKLVSLAFPFPGKCINNWISGFKM